MVSPFQYLFSFREFKLSLKAIKSGRQFRLTLFSNSLPIYFIEALLIDMISCTVQIMIGDGNILVVRDTLNVF